MLLNELLQSPENYAHIVAMTNSDCEIICSEKDAFIIHSKTTDTYSVEVRPVTSPDPILQKLKDYSVDLLITTVGSIYDRLHSGYEEAYMCYQYTFPLPYDKDSNIKLLDKKDLNYVQTTYDDVLYISQLFDRNQILGYYVDEQLIGYIVHHIDGTLGALYVDPKYRAKGYGAKIVKAAVFYFNDKTLYSHVLSTNEPSIKLHKAIDAKKSDVNVYWMYNKGFQYYD